MSTTVDFSDRIKFLQTEAAKAEKDAKGKQSAAKEKESMAADAIPVKVQAKYLAEMSRIDKKNSRKNPLAAGFWHDLSTLALDFGLRNIEARELRLSEIVLGGADDEEGDDYVLLNYSKQVKSFVTKNAHVMIKKDWIINAQKLLFDFATEQGDEVRKYAADDAGDTETGCDKELVKIAIKLGVEDTYQQEKELHYWQNIAAARNAARKLSKKPKGRKIYIKGYPHSVAILLKRIKAAHESGSDYLFPANSLPGNRAQAKGFEPVTRQTAYRIIRTVREKIAASSVKFRKLLKDIRICLHSCRKAACQRVFKETGDLLEASIFLGHGNSEGDIAVTQAYMDKSKARKKEVYKRASQNSAHNAVYDEYQQMMLAEGV